jgi:hypothetical protein
MQIDGVIGVYWLQDGCVISAMLASTHIGRTKATAAAAKVAEALGVAIEGDIVVM